MVSNAELDYALRGAAANAREDGRGRLDVRDVVLETNVLPQASGSSRLRTQGGPEVIVGVVAVLSEPDPATPDSGRVSISVDVCANDNSLTCALPEYEGTSVHDEDKRLWLEGALSQLYAPRSLPIALRKLCIAPGRRCWELKVRVRVICFDGCPLDAASLAVRAALHATRVPKITMGEPVGEASKKAAADLEVHETLDDSMIFDTAALPLYVTLCNLDGNLVADCTAKERQAAGSAISLALDADGDVTALIGGGLYGSHFGEVGSAMAAARALGAECHAAAVEVMSR